MCVSVCECVCVCVCTCECVCVCACDDGTQASRERISGIAKQIARENQTKFQQLLHSKQKLQLKLHPFSTPSPVIDYTLPHTQTHEHSEFIETCMSGLAFQSDS